MTSKTHLPRLLHILDAIGDILALVEAYVSVGPRPDRHRRLLLERNFEIISEASRHLPADLKARHPEIPWNKIAGIGNILRHGYDVVEPDVLVATAKRDLPVLRSVCALEVDRVREGGATG